MSRNSWDRNFSNKEYIYGKEPNVFLEEMSDLFSKNSKIACLAEGEGRNAVFLAKKDHEVTSYDISEVGLKKTKRLAKERKVSVQTVQIDLTKERIPRRTYDAATLIFGHVPKEKQDFLFRNLFESVKVGGYVLFEVYSTKQIQYKTGGPRDVSFLYHAEDLLKFVQQHEVLHFYYGETERYEGINHTGLCHVLQGVVKIKE